MLANPPQHRSALVVINRKSGTVRSLGADIVQAEVSRALADVFPHLDVELIDGDVTPRVKNALKAKSHDVIIAGGGDGTIASVAALMIDTDVTMGSLPLGTMNLFVQALGFAPKLDQALAQFAIAEPDMIDVGLVNDRVFLHQVSFGLQPRMARLREKLGYRSRLGKMVSAARALAMLLLRPKMVRVDIDLDGEQMRVSAPLIAITNNPIGSDKNWSVQHRLDSGVLGYYALTDFSWRSLFKLARDYMRNRLHDNDIVENRTASNLKLKRRPRRFEPKIKNWKRRKSILASIDGEVVVLDNPVEVKIKRQCLKVLTVSARPIP